MPEMPKMWKERIIHAFCFFSLNSTVFVNRRTLAEKKWKYVFNAAIDIGR
jgi:hypothetical protein